MKRFAFVFAVAAVVLAAACTKEEVKKIDSVDQNLVTYTFTAICGEDVKSTLGTNGAFSWVKDDKIAIWNSAANNNTGAYVTFTVGEVNNGEAEITGTAAAGAVWGFAIYPESRAAGNGDAVDYTKTDVAGPILVSKVPANQTLEFKYLGTVMNIQVNSVPDTPTALTLTANADVFGVRSFIWGDSEGIPTLGSISGTAQASVTVPFNASGVTTVPVPNVDLSGFNITVDDAAGRHLYKKTTSYVAPLAAKILVNMPSLEYEAPTKFYVTTTSSTGYWDKSNVRMIQTASNEFVSYMNTDGNTTIKIFDEYNVGRSKGEVYSYTVVDDRLYKIMWKDGSGSVTYISTVVNKPFGNNDYPVDNMCISSDFNSWAVSDKFTYNGNMNWVIENIAISAGTYNFKIRKADSDNWHFAAGGNSGLGSSLYGSLKGDNGDASITLTAGTYNIYLNATTEWYYNIMFEKQ